MNNSRSASSENWLLQIWKWFSLLNFRYPDAVTLSRARLILRMCRILVPASLLSLMFVLARLGTPTDPLTRGLSIAASLIVFIPGLLTVRWIQQGKRERAELIFIISIATAAIALFFVHGFSDPILLVLMIPILLGGFLYGRAGVTWSAFAVSVILIIRAILASEIAPHQAVFEQTVNPNAFGLFFGLVLFIANAAMLLGFLTVRGTNTLPNSTGRTFDTQVTPILLSIAKYRTYQEMFEQAAEDLRAQLGYYYIQLFVYDAPTGLLVRAGQRGALNPKLREEHRVALEDTGSVIAEAARGTQPRLITEISALSERAEFLAGTRSELLIPIQQEGALVGVLDIHSTGSNAFSANEIEQVQSIGVLVAFALRQLKFADEAASGLDERQALREQLSQLREQLGRIQTEADMREWGQFLGNQPGHEFRVTWADRQIVPASAPTLPMDVNLAHTTSPEIRIENGQQALYVPIVVRGQPLGGMAFHAAEGVRWDERSLDTATAIGQRLTLMLENLRLIEEARTAVMRERLINDVTSKLQAQTSLEDLLSTAARMFSQSLGATSTTIQILPQENRSILMNTGTEPLLQEAAALNASNESADANGSR